MGHGLSKRRKSHKTAETPVDCVTIVNGPSLSTNQNTTRSRLEAPNVGHADGPDSDVASSSTSQNTINSEGSNTSIGAIVSSLAAGTDHQRKAVLQYCIDESTTETLPFWQSPYESINPIRQVIRYHNSLTEYVKARNFRRRNRVPVEPEHAAQGAREIPSLFIPFTNKTFRVYLRLSGHIRDTRYRKIFKEYDYLLKHVHFLNIQILNTPMLQDRVKIVLYENHRNRKRPASLSLVERPMFVTNVWFIHGPQQIMIIRGIEFTLALQVHQRSEDESILQYITGTYKRYMDTLSTQPNVVLLWDAEILPTNTDMTHMELGR